MATNSFDQGGLDNMNPTKGGAHKALLDKIRKLEHDLKIARSRGKWEDVDKIEEKIRTLKIEAGID